MFKLTGLIFLSSAIVMLFNKNIYKKYCTYLFLKETVILLEKMKTGCILGKTYKCVYDTINFENFIFYNSYGRYSYPWLLSDEVIKLCDDFFIQAGKRNKKEELEYLELSVSLFSQEAQKNKDYFDKNKKVHSISSIAIVLVIAIMII